MMMGRGYAVASIGYRLSGEAKFPAQIHDCKAAIRFLRANAKKYNIDPERIGVVGQSAAGTSRRSWARRAASRNSRGRTGRPTRRARCNWWSITSARPTSRSCRRPARGPNPVTRLIGGDLGEKAALAKQANPIEFVTPDDPPFLILHGGQGQARAGVAVRVAARGAEEGQGRIDLPVRRRGGHDGRVMTDENRKKFVELCDRVLKAKR
jgi:acetyl esterase/lipase